MDHSAHPWGLCVITGCHAPGEARFTYPVRSGEDKSGVVLCRAHLEQMLRETGLIEKPAYRDLLDEH